LILLQLLLIGRCNDVINLDAGWSIVLRLPDAINMFIVLFLQ